MENAVSGLFVTVEGGEGVGKSTQARRLADALRASGRIVVETREPGGTPVGDRIRAVLLDPASEMTARTEALLYEASRAQLAESVIAPALEAGDIVVCDRFIDSTTAYQAYGRRLDLEQVRSLNLLATGGIRPDVTVLLTLGLEESLRRATHGGADRMERESLEFHRRVHDGFLEIAAAEPARFVTVEAAGGPDEVAAAVWSAFSSHPAVRIALGRE
jgi:dTMP kinase